MAGLPNPRSLETGNETKIEIKCSQSTADAVKRMFADIDPNMTYEEAILHIYRRYYRNPSRFE